MRHLRYAAFALCAVAALHLFWLHSAIDDAARADDGAIPRVALFNHRVNLLLELVPSLHAGEAALRRNVLRTLNVTGMRAVFYDDAQCRALLADLEAEWELRWLAESFDRSPDGRIRSDMCRLAMLWRFGGYYFDTDMLVLRNVSEYVYPFTRFATCKATSVFANPKGFFQSFVASVPRHPMLRRALVEHVRWFDTVRAGDAARIRRVTGGSRKPNLGTVFLRDAHEGMEGYRETVRIEHVGFSYRSRMQLFMEASLRDVDEHVNRSGLCVPCEVTDPCGFAVYDPVSGDVLFKSRIVNYDNHAPCQTHCDDTVPLCVRSAPRASGAWPSARASRSTARSVNIFRKYAAWK
jgi:hypothetical protein